MILRTVFRRPQSRRRPPASVPAVLPALPEAPFSLTLKGTLDGQDALLTVRGSTPAEFQANLAAVRAMLDPVAAPATPSPQDQLSPAQHNAAAMHKRVSGFCPVHNVTMQWNEGKEGKRGWYSHKTKDGWCKGR